MTRLLDTMIDRAIRFDHHHGGGRRQAAEHGDQAHDAVFGEASGKAITPTSPSSASGNNTRPAMDSGTTKKVIARR